MVQDTSVTVRTIEGDRLDLLCWKHYGSLAGRVVEQTLEANQGIASYDELPAGLWISLPVIAAEPLERTLW